MDILSAKILNRPIVTPRVDVASLLAAVVASFSVSRTILAGRHIEVEFIVARVAARGAKDLQRHQQFPVPRFFLPHRVEVLHLRPRSAKDRGEFFDTAHPYGSFCVRHRHCLYPRRIDLCTSNVSRHEGGEISREPCNLRRIGDTNPHHSFSLEGARGIFDGASWVLWDSAIWRR